MLANSRDDDPLVSTELDNGDAREWDGTQLVVLPGCGDVPQEECASESLEAVEDFAVELRLHGLLPSDIF